MIVIAMLLLTANFAFTVTDGYEVSFTDTSDGANIVSWSWDFGDGTTSEEQNPTHSYSVAGVYQVKLTVTNVDGLEDITTKTIVTTCDAPALTLTFFIPIAILFIGVLTIAINRSLPFAIIGSVLLIGGAVGLVFGG